MTTEEAFLAAIRETPDDDAPRLIFADWLEDNGDPERAEFIRLLVRAAAMAPGFSRLREQAGELLARNWRAWVLPLHQAVGASAYEPWLRLSPSPYAVEHFPRGFVSHLTLDAPRFLQHAEALFRAAPLTDLSFRKAEGRGAALAQRPELEWVRRLAFIDFYSSPLGPADAEALARSPYLSRLRLLALAHNNVADAGARAVASAAWLPGLRALDLTENGLSAEGARALAESSGMASLHFLSLSGNPIGDAGVEALLRARWLPRLESLGLHGSGVTARGIALLQRRAPGLRLFHDVRPPDWVTP